MVKNNFAYLILAFIFSLVSSGIGQEFPYTFPQDQGQEQYYLDSYYSSYYPSAYWSYPYVPAKYAVQAAKERLRANKYMNPNSAFWEVQRAKERLWIVKNTCYDCWQDYGWMDRGDYWESRY